MVDFTLRLSVPASPAQASLRSSFYWTAQGPSSFEGPFGPRLGRLGPVRAQNVDFARLALAVFAADRTTPRKGSGTNWSRRELALRVPVSDVDAWNAGADELQCLFAFLTGDAWTLDFYQARPPKEPIQKQLADFGPTRVVLVSGGADSAIGALWSRSQLPDNEGHVLLSHVGAKNLGPIQKDLAGAVEKLLPGPAQLHLPIGLRRRTKQVDGTPFANEASSRSRSLLFLSLGLAAASVYGVPVWIPENGFASLNPPLDPNRRGSLSTRTTHPAFLGGLSRVLATVGAHAEIRNPFADLTKGEMFTRAAELIGADQAATFLGNTHSCGLTGQRAFGIPLTTQCGVCYGCVVRRASFTASALRDTTTYIPLGADPRVDAWLARSSVDRPMRGLVRRGVTRRELLTMDLPPSYPTAAAVDLCARAIDELRQYYA